MRFLDRYLLRELLVPLSYCLGGFLLFWTVFDLFTSLGDLQEDKMQAIDIVQYYLVRAPEILVLILPVALLLALLYALTTHARHHEIAALQFRVEPHARASSSGVSGARPPLRWNCRIDTRCENAPVTLSAYAIASVAVVESVAGTMLVADINPGRKGSAPRSLTDVNGRVFFSASDGTRGRELWKTAESPEVEFIARADANPTNAEYLHFTVGFTEDVIGVDPAEGNPQSDESAAVVLDVATGEQVATLGLRCDPELFAVHLDRLSQFYGAAPAAPLGSSAPLLLCAPAEILVERNNHGHAVILALRYAGASLLRGLDREIGWATTGAIVAAP